MFRFRYLSSHGPSDFRWCPYNFSFRWGNGHAAVLFVLDRSWGIRGIPTRSLRFLLRWKLRSPILLIAVELIIPLFIMDEVFQSQIKLGCVKCLNSL
ncbi:hypothetical protein CsatB_030143 [Cannabis sativa]